MRYPKFDTPTKTQHPISIATNSRIDIFLSGSQMNTTRDMMLLLEQTIERLEKDQHVLVINTLCAHDDLAAAADKLSVKDRGGVAIYSASGAKLREKLDFLTTLITAKQVKMIVLNSWEFAANGSRQKHALAMWLREMRDTFKIRVVIYSCAYDLPKTGAIAMLVYAATIVDNVGAWSWEAAYDDPCAFEPNATDTVNAYIAEREARERGETPVVPQYGPFRIVTSSELIHRLKNKDLAPVSAHPVVEVEEEELEACI